MAERPVPGASAVLTRAARALLKEASYIDALNAASGRGAKLLSKGVFRVGRTMLRKGVPLAGRLGIAGVKGTGRALQWASDLAVRHPALAVSGAGLPAVFALRRYSPERMDALNEYADPHSQAATYRVGLLRNSIEPYDR